MMHRPTTTPSARARTNGPAARTGRWLTTHPVLGYVILLVRRMGRVERELAALERQERH